MANRAAFYESRDRNHGEKTCSQTPDPGQPWGALVDTVALRIRRSLALPNLLQSSVDEVQHLLGCDRVLIYRFNADWSGQVVVEAVSEPQWSLMDRVIHDACFEASWLEPYQEKRYFAVDDIATAHLTPCHAEFLASFQVRANLVIPLVQQDDLWGLLIAHHCQAPQPWQPVEIEGLQRLALEIEIAIYQATLLERLQTAKTVLEDEVATRIRELEQANQSLQTMNQRLVEESRERHLVEVERLQAQTQLKQISAIVASSQDAIMAETLTGIITSWNQAAEDIFGYTAEEMIGQPMTTLIPPHCQDEAAQKLSQIRQGKRVETYETQQLHKNGQPIDVSLTVSALYDEHGHIIGASKIARDITAHKRDEDLRKAAESALRDSQHQFELFMRYAPALTWITDVNGVAQYANSRWLDFVGKTAESALEKPLEALFSPEVSQEFCRNNQQVIESNAILETTQSVPDQNGELHTFLICKFPIHQDQDIIAVGGIGIDITARTKAEAALKESETRWQFAIEGAGDGLWDWDINANNVFYSRQWKAMLGYEGHEISSHINEWESRLHPDDQAQCYAKLAQHFQKETEIYQSEYRFRCKDGSYKWILDRGKVMEWDADGQPLRMIGTHTDISDRKNFEAKLQQSEATNRAILMAIPDLLLRVSRDGTCYDCLLPQEPHEGDLLPIHQHLSEVLPADLLAQQLHAIDTALREGKPQTYEHQIQKNDHLCYEEIRIVPSGENECLLIVRDITESKQAEVALHHSEATNRILIQSIPDLLVRMRKDGTHLEIINKGNICYLCPDEFADREHSVLDAMPVDIAQERIDLAQVAMATGQSQKQEYCFVKDGRTYYEEARISPLVEDEVLVIVRDITNRKEAEAKLRQREQEYRLLIDNLPAGVVVHGPTSEILTNNTRAAELLGLTADQMQGKTALDPAWLFLEEDGVTPMPLEQYPINQVLASGKPIENQVIGMRHSGGNRVVWVLANAYPLFSNDQTLDRVIVTFVDITAQKQAQFDLTATKEQLELVLQASSEGFWDWDLITNEIYFSPRWKEMLGYADHELENTLDMWKSIISREDYDAALQLVKDFNNGLADRFSSVQRFHHKNGSTVYILSRAVNVRDHQGKAVRMVGSHLDITSTIHIQEALKNSEMQLSGILNSSLDGIMAFRSVRNDHGQIIDFEWLLSNPTACQMVHKQPDELIGHHLLETMPGNREDGLFDLYVQVVTIGTPIQRQFHYNHDGIETWFEAVAVQLGDGFVVTFRDISAVKASEQALQKANRALETHVRHLRQRNDEMLMLSETSDFLQACRTLEEACAVISTLVQPLFPECSGSFYITCASRNRVEAVAKWGDTAHIRDDFQPHDCWGLRRGRWHHITPDRPGLRCNHIVTDSPTLTSLCIPMIAQGETLGLFYLSTDQPDVLDQPKQQLACTVAEQVGLAIANLHLRETLQSQSIRDSLTGLFNRRYLEEALDTELVRAQRHHYPTAIIMIDVDHFKSFNDQYGHDAGDIVLKEIAQVLKDSVRGSDIACRYGGEELILILPETSLADALAKAEDLRAAIRRIDMTYGGQTLSQLTASFGVAVFPDHGLHRTKVIQAADAALYRAKAAGRDRVISAADTQLPLLQLGGEVGHEFGHEVGGEVGNEFGHEDGDSVA